MPFPDKTSDKKPEKETESMPPAKADAKPDTKGKTPLPPDKAADMLLDAEAQGNLKPLEDVLKMNGVGQSAADIMAAASKHPATKGKTVSEVAAMLDEDSGLLDEIVQDAEGPEDKESSKPGEYDGMNFGEALHSKMGKATAEDNAMEM